MSESSNAASPTGSPTPERPVEPSTAWVPGAGLLFVGLWMVTDGGPLPLGWAFFALGLALTLIGSVAKGVVWGLELYAAEAPSRDA